MISFRKRQRFVPNLNTASLPDLIFTVLFFFMIVTHMREVTLKVKYRVPQGTELTRLTKKSAVSYVYIGVPLSTSGTANERNVHIQLNDKFVTPDDLVDYITEERHRMSPEDLQQMTVSIKADRQVRMSTLNEVKLALRKANALRINYSATEKPSPKN